MAKPGCSVRGYCLRDITFHTALKTSLGPEGTETQFYLRPRVSADERDNAWFDFRLCTIEEGEWVENSRGQICAEYEGNPSIVDAGREAKEEAITIQETLQTTIERCTLRTEATQFYANLNSWGFGLGKPFQRLRDISYNHEGSAKATVDLYAEPSDSSEATEAGVVHPVTLDGVLQLVFPSLTQGGSHKIPTMVPTRVKKLWISNTGLNSHYTEQLTCLSDAKFSSSRGARSSIIALDKISGDVRIKVDGFETTAVVNPNNTLEEYTERRLCYSMKWKPDMALLDPEQILEYCNDRRSSVSQPVQFCQDLELLCFTYMHKLLKQFNLGSFTNLQPHLLQYIRWIERRIADFDTGTLQTSQPEWRELREDQRNQKELQERLQESDSHGYFYIEVAKNLSDIFHGKVDVLDFLFGGDLVSNFYRDAEGPWNCMRSLLKYLDCVAHKNPRLNILEIGAGTGGASAPVLDVLRLNGDNEYGVPRYECYDYTDISPSFFAKAKDLFKDHGDKIHFTRLDIEDEPGNQGFSLGSYDVVFAANVLHATKDISTTLQNTRKLLKPGAKLILLEVCNPELLRTGFVFGLLSGWWLSTEKKRQWSPILFEKDWDELLCENGFSGVDITFRDYDDDNCHETSIMISTAVEPVSKQPKIPPVAIITSEKPSMHQLALAQDISRYVTGKGSPHCELMSLREAASNPALMKVLCISTLEIDISFFVDIDSKGFKDLKKVMESAKGLIWVTHGGEQSPKRPEMDIVTGFFRSARTEYAGSILVQVALESSTLSIEQESNIISRVVDQTIMSPVDSCEMEYVERGGILNINRVVEASTLNANIYLRTLKHRAALHQIGECPPLQLRVESPGLLNSLDFVENTIASEVLAADEIEVEVKACGVNFRDILIALGRYADDDLGSECAGIVSNVGAAVSLKPGDRVCLCVLGTYKTAVRCRACHAAKIPDFMSFAEAASMPTTSITAYYALHEIARLKTGESVLIHSAAGGTGQAAIQVAKLAEAEIFATVSSEEKKKLLIEAFGILEDHIFDSRDLSFAKGVMRMTHGRGVDVVLNSLSGEGLVASWECIAPFGRFIEIGKKDIESHGRLPMHRFAENVSFAAVDLAYITRKNSELLRQLLERVMDLASSRKLCPSQPIHLYRASQIEEAFRLLQTGKNTGKAIIELNKQEVVPVR